MNSKQAVTLNLRKERAKTFSDWVLAFQEGVNVRVWAARLIAHVHGARKHINPQHMDMFNPLFIGKGVW